MAETTQLQVVQDNSTHASFGTPVEFEHAQRMAKALCSASLVPDIFKNSIPNTMIALEMAHRIGASPLMVMQNMYVVHGKPSWSSQFVISAVNACGRFAPLRFVVTGAGETLSCYAWSTDKKTGEKLKGVTVTMAMAHAEGWVNKPGSKWKTMPELMIQYRAGTFFGRLYAPDILQGMHTEDEVEDFTALATPDQLQYIENLLSTSTYDEQRVRAVNWQVNKGVSVGEAMQIVAELKLNQISPTDAANNGATGAKDAVHQIING